MLAKETCRSWRSQTGSLCVLHPLCQQQPFFFFWKELISAMLPVQRLARHPVENDRVKHSEVLLLVAQFSSAWPVLGNNMTSPGFCSPPYNGVKTGNIQSGVSSSTHQMPGHLWTDHDWGSSFTKLWEWGEHREHEDPGYWNGETQLHLQGPMPSYRKHHLCYQCTEDSQGDPLHILQ